MSCITEHTMIIKSCNKQDFEKDFERLSEDFRHRLSNLVNVYSSDQYAVYVFDCNGDGPWYMGEADTEFEALEINYLDDEDNITERRINGCYQEVEEHMADFLKDYMPLDDAEELRLKIF